MKVDRPGSRGFTLVELLIAGLVSVIVLVGVLTASGAQTRSYAVGSRQTLAQAYGRGALLYMEQHLAWAGYGIDPVLAFDFDRYTTGPCPAEMSPCPRDTRTNSDELVFYARNPRYWVPGAGNVAGATGGPAEPAGNAWTIRGGGLGPTATTMTIGARQGDSFSRGQIVLAVCRGGQFYTFATIAQNVAPLGNPQDYTLTLAAASASDPFNRPDLAVSPAAGAACFAAGDARLFLVDRYRFHVRPETAGNNVIPYLVLDQGIDRNRDGTIDADDELVIAEGVEDLQVAYVLANPLLPTPVVGEGGAIVAGEGRRRRVRLHRDVEPAHHHALPREPAGGRRDGLRPVELLHLPGRSARGGPAPHRSPGEHRRGEGGGGHPVARLRHGDAG